MKIMVQSPKHLHLIAQLGACAFVAPLACAQAESKELAPAQSLSVSAKETRSGALTLYKWATWWGSYDRDFFSQEDVEIEAHNLSRLPADIEINFYFVCRREDGSGPQKLVSKRTFTISLPPGQKRVSLRSDVLQSNEQRYVALGQQYISGYRLVGWFLQARVPNDARPFAYASSEPAWIERRQWFDAALAEFDRGTARAAPKANRKSTTQSRPAVARATATVASVEAPSGDKSVPGPPSYVITTTDIPLRLDYGEVVIRSGTQLRVVRRDASTVYVEFGNTVIPLSVSLVQ